MAQWQTYQSGIISPDIARGHIEAEYQTSDFHSPVIGATFDGQCTVVSEGLYHNGRFTNYRFPQSVRDAWYTNFDWEVEQRFQVERFEAQFGQRYDTEIKSLPSYDESRLLYGR